MCYFPIRDKSWNWFWCSPCCNFGKHCMSNFIFITYRQTCKTCPCLSSTPCSLSVKNPVYEVNDPIAGQDVFDDNGGLFPLAVGHNNFPTLSPKCQFIKVVGLAFAGATIFIFLVTTMTFALVPTCNFKHTWIIQMRQGVDLKLWN